MEKLETLTPEQEAKIPEVEGFWSDYLLSCKNSINEKEATLKIEWLYRFCELDEPVVIYVDSPLACQYAVAYLKEIFDQPEFEEDKVRDKVAAKVRDKVGAKVGDKVAAKVRDKVRDKVWAKVGAKVRAKVWAKVGAKVWDKVEAKVRAKVEYHSFASYGSVSDYGWVSFYDFFQITGIIEEDRDLQEFKSLLLSGIYDMIQLNGFCIVSDLPSEIHQNESGLHCEDGPAIKFRDGFEVFYWKGTEVPEKLILFPDKIDKKDIENHCDNAEVRRCFIEALGVSKYFDILSNGKGLELIDEGIDHQGFPMKLFEFDFEGDTIQMLECTDPSTGRVYNIAPPSQNCTNVFEAKYNTFEDKVPTYRQGDVGLLKEGDVLEKPLIET